jgi:hypothetical protein
MKKLLLLLYSISCLAGNAQNGFTTYSCTITGTNSAFANRSCIVQDNTNNIWLGFNSAGSIKLIKFDGSVWTDHSTAAPSGINSLSADQLGNIWIGTSGSGIAKYDGSTFTSYNQSNSSIISNNILSVNVINAKVYVGTTMGFSEFDGTNFVNYSSSNSGLTSNLVYCFEKENAQIWIGTGHGLHSLNAGIISYTGDTVRINDIMIDGNANKWLGTEYSGLLKYDNSIFSPLAIPLVIGGNIPTRIKGIGRSINNNPVINTEKFNLNTYVKNALLELLPGNDYRLYVHHAHVPNDCVFISDPSGDIWFTDARRMPGPGANIFMAKNCLHRFQQNQYNPSVEITTITPENVQFLDINNVSAGCNPNADIHSDGTKSLYEAPKGSASKPTFASKFWVGGYVNGTLRTAANTYREAGTDFWPGPIHTLTGTTDTATAQQFNRVWKLNRFDVENFKFNYLNGNVQNGTFPILNEIMTWPGNGTQAGEMLAPYFDYNNDMYYDPMDGDYPLIKGDQMLWWVFNDALATHAVTGTVNPLKIQVQASAYAFTCPALSDSDKVLNYTTFYNYKLINKSTDIIDSMYIGMTSDVDLGNYNDDYVGCDVTNNFAFVYNGDVYDDDVAHTGVTGYHSNTPYFSYNVLRGPTADMNDGSDNDRDGCIDCTFQLDPNGQPDISLPPLNESAQRENTAMSSFLFYHNNADVLTGNPGAGNNGSQFYNYMSGHLRTGAPMTYGGFGTFPTGPVCSYLLPGTSDPLGYGVGGGPGNPIPMPAWDEVTSSGTPGDRRLLANTGTFTMQPGEVKELDYAYVFTQDSVALANGVLYNKVVSDNQKIKKWFTLNNAPSCLDMTGVGLKEADHKLQMIVFPNPASNSLTIDAGNNNTILKLKVYDILGKELFAQENIRTTRSQLNIVSMSAGVYLLEVQSEQGAYFTKFIKQ